MLATQLEEIGWSTWFDEDQMVGNIDAAMVAGIDDADAIIVCLTAKYCEKVSSAAADLRQRDNCLNEWTYANNRKKVLVPVIMEPSMRNPSDWPPGVVTMHFGSTLYVDASSSTDMKDVAHKLSAMLNRLNINRRVVQFKRPSPATHRSPPPLTLRGDARSTSTVLQLFRQKQSIVAIQ
tara:strand:+ start:469 stop:1005 length:537 start_codon:yes stop_codon:yes gene_type:complete